MIPSLMYHITPLLPWPHFVMSTLQWMMYSGHPSDWQFGIFMAFREAPLINGKAFLLEEFLQSLYYVWPPNDLQLQTRLQKVVKSQI